MINTLQNSPERVPSKGGNKFKKAIALAIALTLSGQPAEGKTYEKQEFSTEMVANNPGEASLTNENIEQSTVPNYINRAQNGVRKYYPQYEEYFRPIFSAIYGSSNNAKKIINEKIHENFEIFEEEIGGEKNKCEIVLMALEQLMGANTLISTRNLGISIESKEISKEISNDINYQVKKEISNNIKETQNIRERNNKLKEILNYMNSGKKDKETTYVIATKIEEYFTLYNISEIKKDEGLQKIIKQYIVLNNQIKREPSGIGKSFINEYNKINR